MSMYPTLHGTSEFIEDGEAIRQRVLDSLPGDLKLPLNYAIDAVDVTTIPETCNLLNENELAITAMDATAVRDAIASRKLTAVEVVMAFGRRAAIAHQLVCCKCLSQGGRRIVW